MLLHFGAMVRYIACNNYLIINLMSPFATLALLGGVCANAHWADLAGYHDVHYEHPNALDQMAQAMVEKNAKYAEDTLLNHSEMIPVYHIVHEAESSRYMNLRQEESETSSESSESEEGDESSEEDSESDDSSSLSESSTASEQDGANEIDEDELSSSEFDSSDISDSDVSSLTDSSLYETTDDEEESSESENEELSEKKPINNKQGENAVPNVPFKPKAEWK